jgi:hypothetical protein
MSSEIWPRSQSGVGRQRTVDGLATTPGPLTPTLITASGSPMPKIGAGHERNVLGDVGKHAQFGRGDAVAIGAAVGPPP